MAKRKAAAESTTTRDLRRRLREAEETLDAIRDGHVEALVVHTPEGEQVFTLHSADQAYRLMVEQMREGALNLAADGTILYGNSRFAELMGLPAERITGRNLAEFVEPAEVPKLWSLLAASSFREEFQLRPAVGDSIPAQLSSTAMTIDGLRTVAVVVSDLTHERTARGLRESNRLKDEFLATLSHELRTPLNVILGWTHMLRTDQLPERTRRQALEIIDRNAQAQAQLVNDLVDMSRMTTGKLRLDLQPIPIVPALEQALDSVRPSAASKGLTIETAWGSTDASVLADATRLQQVFWNLLSNAVKFTPPGGHIAVRAHSAGDRVRVDVSDSGIGIDRAFLPHVFGRFRQADSGATRTYGGLGLGLAIVHDLVHLHGGDIAVRSDGIGRGTTVEVTLLASARAVLPSPRPRVVAPSSLAGHTVLLVEDHQDSRELLARQLQAAGAVVVACGAAADAWSALEHVQPTVIVADIGMAGEDGYSFMRRIRAHSAPAIRSIPAIAVTAYAAGADRAESFSAGFQTHLSKPLDPALLVEAIDEFGHRGTSV